MSIEYSNCFVYYNRSIQTILSCKKKIMFIQSNTLVSQYIMSVRLSSDSKSDHASSLYNFPQINIHLLVLIVIGGALIKCAL